MLGAMVPRALRAAVIGLSGIASETDVSTGAGVAVVSGTLSASIDAIKILAILNTLPERLCGLQSAQPVASREMIGAGHLDGIALYKSAPVL
jgi:hypothetical protein